MGCVSEWNFVVMDLLPLSTSTGLVAGGPRDLQGDTELLEIGPELRTYLGQKCLQYPLFLC